MAAYVQPGFVVAIINDGKTIREQNVNNERVARIPFGSEYKIRIQNKTDYRAYAKVLIDGTEVHTGKLILRAGEKVDLERFLLDGDNSSGKRLKFVEAGNSQVQDPTAKENGEIEVVFEGEDYFSQLASMLTTSGSSYGYNTPIGATFATNTAPVSGAAFNCSTGGILRSKSILNRPEIKADAGATIEGSVSTQAFQTSYENFRTFAPQSVKIRLKGPGEPVRQIIQEPQICHQNSVKPWGVFFENGKVALRSYGQDVAEVEGVEVTATHLVVKIPMADVQVGWAK